MLNHLLRYEPVVREVEAMRGGTLLEVGSGGRGIARYLSARWELTACDVSFSDYGAQVVGPARGVVRVQASVLQMPFADRAFDVVVALDLLEHLSPADRPAALAQLRRVTRLLLVVGCPTGAEALRCDERLARFYGRIRRRVPTWLQEHLRNGFPEAATLAEQLQAEVEGDGDLVLIANEALTAHALISRVEALPVLWSLTGVLAWLMTTGLKHPRWRPLVQRALVFLRAGDCPPAYRTIAALSRRPDDVSA